jgi:hypothetical protein
MAYAVPSNSRAEQDWANVHFAKVQLLTQPYTCAHKDVGDLVEAGISLGQVARTK